MSHTATTLHSPREAYITFTAVAFPNCPTAATDIIDCTARTTLPPSSHGQARPAIADSGAGNRGIVPSPIRATNPSIVGGKRPTPHFGDHVCTSTSNIANIAADDPAARTVTVT